MKKTIFMFGIICLALSLSSLPLVAEEKKFEMAPSYYIYPGDVLEVNVYGAEHMHTPPFKIRVSGDGTVHFPLLGRIDIAGLTEIEATEKIDKMYRDRGVLKAPQVTLIVMEKAWLIAQRQYSISGAVAKPGKYPVTGAVMLLDAINLAGGLSGEANTSEVKVLRLEEGIEKEYIVDLDEQGADFEIIVRDKIIVGSRGTYFINGQIVSPGRYYLSEDLTAAQAIIEAGGFTDVADENNVKVVRTTDGETKVIRVPVASVLRRGKKSKDIVLKNGDIVEVPESWF